MLAPALAAVIAAGEGRKEGSVLLYSIRSAGTVRLICPLKKNGGGGMLGSRNLDSWNMTRRFFYIHASGLFVNTGFCMG